GIAERVLRVEVEGVRHAVEHEGIVDHRYSLAGRWARTYSSRSATAEGGGRKRRMSRALGARRSVVQASSQTIATSSSLIPGAVRICSFTSVSTPAANGHQPAVRGNSPLAT